MSLFIPHKSFNFTEEEYNNAKMRDELPCTCEQCGKQFMRTKRELSKITKEISKIKHIFCSSECSKQHRTTSIKTNCTYCGKEITVKKNVYEKSETKHFFCNNSCRASYTNSHRVITEEHKKKISDINKQKYKEKTGFSTRKEKKQAERVCKVCGQNICLHSKICKSNIFKNSINLINLGFDISKIGSVEVYSEYIRIQKYLFNLYHIQGMSYLDIMKRHNIKSEHSMTVLFNFFNIERRTISEANTLATLNGKLNQSEFKYQYKTGWHTSWENKQFYFRSSYEEDYMKELDEKKISYDGEIFRIAYFDTQKQRLRVAIPDIYLPDTKTIVEIKSDYTYDKQEMIDKSNEYKRLGFNFKLVLEHIEYDYCV